MFFLMRLFHFIACLMWLSNGLAQAQETSGGLAGTLQALPADNCGRRNIPGGYPCRGACQPCMIGVDCACGCGAEQRWSDMKQLDFGHTLWAATPVLHVLLTSVSIAFAPAISCR